MYVYIVVVASMMVVLVALLLSRTSISTQQIMQFGPQIESRGRDVLSIPN